jgi:membrane-bound lytic murein transglycosylase MltF
MCFLKAICGNLFFMKPNLLMLMVLALLLAGCEPGDKQAQSTNAPQTAVEAAPENAPESPPAPAPAEAETAGVTLDELESKLGLKVLAEAWSGDLQGMIDRRLIRVLTVYGLGRYYFQDGYERGFAVENMNAFGETINQHLKSYEKVYVVFVPVSRDQLLPALLAGRGDIAVAGLTITPERQQLVDFSDPLSTSVKEILATGPAAEPIASVQELSGKTIHVRETSSYFASLKSLSDQLVAEGKAAIDIQFISDRLEDEDLLEMVAAGLLPWIVIDSYKAEMFEGVFEGLTFRQDLVFRDGAQIGYAFRKNSPQLAEALNAHMKNYRQGSLHGNILIKRYVEDFDWVENALESESYGRFTATAEIFKKYGEQYGMDYLLIAAQGYQESRLDQSAKSHAGAIGIMQLLPTTAADPNVGIPDISTIDANIHAGVKYIDFLRSRYFNDPAIDEVNQTLLAMASYNAGPARIASLRKKAADQGLDPNRWFGNVEVIVAKEVGREPVQYVANIYKYYISYRLALAQIEAKQAARESEGIN